MIAINIPAHTIALAVTDQELAVRRAKWTCPEPKITAGLGIGIFQGPDDLGVPVDHTLQILGHGFAGAGDNACPTCGSCSGMYTANSMNCLTEALGMGLGDGRGSESLRSSHWRSPCSDPHLLHGRWPEGGACCS